jgi:dTDP-4-amino-4,6-dideoxygalactose transaminase
MKHEPHGPWYYEQIDLGYNYRITDIQCALIISQLDKIDIFSARRREIVERYNKAFSQIPELFVQQEIPESDTTRHLYILRIKPELLNIDRKAFFAAMDAENISCNVHYQPVYFLPYYEWLGYKRGLCPNAEKLYNEIMSLPLYYSLTDKDVDDVIEAVKKIVDYYKK